MRIEKVLLKNYRPFRGIGLDGEEIKFSKSKETDHDLHVIIGRNGTGKTAILNAINWCLYGDEPHLLKDSEGLSRLNAKAVDEPPDDKDWVLSVEVCAKDSKDNNVKFIRTEDYRVIKQGEKPQIKRLEGARLGAKVTDEKGNMKILSEEDSKILVKRSFPKSIRQFFFFDGEQLHNYFKAASGDSIQKAIFEISRVGILDRIKQRVEYILNHLIRSAEKFNPKIKEVQDYLEHEKVELEGVQKSIDECSKQIRTAKDQIRELQNNLSGKPDVKTLLEDKESRKKQKKEKEDFIETKIGEKNNLLQECSKFLMLWPSIRKTLEIIIEKRRGGEIPPQIRKELLEEILENELCRICGRKLDTESEIIVRALLREVNESSEVARLLEEMEGYLPKKAKLQSMIKQIRKMNQDLKLYEQELLNITQDISRIDADIGGHNIEQIRSWQTQLMNLERVLEEQSGRRGEFTLEKKLREVKIDNFKKTLEEELRRHGVLKKLRKQIEFCEKALSHVVREKDDRMNETKKKIESETKELFFELLWKKEIFKDVTIDENYNIHLIQSQGLDCLGTVSAGETELLALAFTLALHKVSEYDSPIVIDTPLARISDENRKNFGRIFSKISKNKQVILLLTPSEYSDEVKSAIDSEICNMYNLKISPDEKETKVEVR